MPSSPTANTVNCETKGCIHPQVMWDWNKADHYRFHFKGTGLQSFTTTQFNTPGTLHNQNSYEHLLKSVFRTSLQVWHYSSTNQKTKFFAKATVPKHTFLYFPLYLPPMQYSGIMHHIIILLFYLSLLTSQQLEIPHSEKQFIHDLLIYTNIHCFVYLASCL